MSDERERLEQRLDRASSEYWAAFAAWAEHEYRDLPRLLDTLAAGQQTPLDARDQGGAPRGPTRDGNAADGL